MVLLSANENDNLSIWTHHSQQADCVTLALQVPVCSRLAGPGIKEPGVCILKRVNSNNSNSIKF